MDAEIKKLMCSEIRELCEKILTELKEDKTLIEIVHKTEEKNYKGMIASDFNAMIQPMLSEKPRLQKFYQDNALDIESIFNEFKQNFTLYALNQKPYR